MEKCQPFTFLLTMSICFWTSCAQLTIPQGTLQGVIFTTHHQRNISGFLGIPYAKPPIGNLRFANPVRADGWNGTRNASVDTNMCPQVSGDVILGDEDCLYLNVYTPKLPQSGNAVLLPVMVFIHGGRFRRGNARSDTYDPGYLLDEDVILVIPSYRLGPLGFLSTGDEVASGNWGLKDQVLALEWVQDNIEYFGGDPGRVTLFGESAGSVSVQLLALSNSTDGLFHRYITQSGSALATWGYQPRSSYSIRASELGEYVGCSNDTSDSLINCLRTVDFLEILGTFSRFLVWQDQPSIVWTPTDEPDIEGAFLTDSPTNIFAKGGARDVPCISVVVRDEGLMVSVGLYENKEMSDDFFKNIDFILPEMISIKYQSDSGSAWVDAIKSYYFNNDLTANTSVLLSNLTLLINDALFFYPAYNSVKQHITRAKNPAYFFTFNYRGTNSYTFTYGDPTINYGVTHGDNLLYQYPAEVLLKDYDVSVSETDLQMVETIVQLFTSFAINGTPTTSGFDGTATWEPFSTEENYLRIGNESDVALEVEYYFFKERMEFWANLTATPITAAASNSDSKSIAILLIVCLFFLS